MRILLVSSFVLPHAGGVEQFVATIRGMLEQRGCAVRVLACRRPGEDGSADAVVPARYVGPGGWPLPIGGWRTLRREVARADAVIANNALHPLADLAVLAARRRGVPRLLVVHGSGQARRPGSAPLRAAREGFQRTLARLALRRSLPVSVSVTGVEGVRGTHGLGCGYLPYPLPELPVAAPPPAPGRDDVLRVAWVGRLSAEKDPRLAVGAIERLRAVRPATLDVYGAGPLDGELAELAAGRPWLALHGSRPWPEVLEAQERAHVCLSTSTWDNVQVAVLEALARGIPVVCTRVGDAPRYYGEPALERFCVGAGDPEALGAALAELATRYDEHRRAFADNARQLRAIHRDAARVLEELIAVAARGRPRS